MRLCCFGLLLLSVIVLHAQESALIRVGENWRWFKGGGEPSSPPEAWREPGFDDTAWPATMSGFSRGYGDYDEATRFDDFGLGYHSLFARKAFVLTNTSSVKWLTLRIDYKDGFVAYLNGLEVARRNLAGEPGTPVAFNTTATNTHPRGLAEEIDLTPAASALREGANLLAIQVHTTSPNSPYFALVPELLCNFTRGPFVQNTSTNRIQIICKTPISASATVEFGLTPALGQAVANPLPNTTHAFTLENLTPDTRYFYRVRCRAETNEVLSPMAEFRTLKMSGSFSFAVIGDSGTGSAEQYLVAEQLRRARPDLVLHAGDIAYPLLTTNNVDGRCFSVYQPHMKSVPYFFSIGNHDLYGGDFAYLDSFYLPTNPATGTEHYYSFDHGDAHFVSLLQPYASQYLITPGDPQYRWLTNDLAQSTKPWKFIFFHVPMATSGAHRQDDLFRFGTPDRIDILNALLPVASEYGVQMIFSGHDHNYERFNPMQGVYQIVTGGGGVPLRWLAQLDVASSQFGLVHHLVKVSLDADTLRMEAIDLHGRVFDWMTLRRAAPPPKSHEATLHTPRIETEPPDDFDGNINGQLFDFRGTPLPTVGGKFSNLGQVYVNNDRTNFYIGFEQSGIYPDQNIFLFIESPRLAGVTNLASLGNGRMDPDEQGADGLDFLENLSFTNFTPNVALLLGDEMADYQSRSFARLGSPFRTGQGAFYLNRDLADAPGLRLQQFNRAAQTGGFPGEENADFIEVALPFASLGGLRPGDTIKIGAVVGMGGVNTNLLDQSRELDSSFLGASFQSAGFGPALLEGLSVKIAFDPDGDEDNDLLINAKEFLAGTDPFNPDSDTDGLRDGWEVAHQLNPLSASGQDGPDGDPDRDGLSNAREQAQGTAPRDPRSAVRLAIQQLEERQFRFVWPTVPGKRYQLEYSDLLAREFLSVAPRSFPITATSTNETFMLEIAGNSVIGSRGLLFRVRVVE